MAKILPVDIVKGISGKICRHGETIFAYNRSSGKIHTTKICNPYTGPATEKQLAQQAKFKARSLNVSRWLLANHPSDTNPHGTDEYRHAQSLKKQYGLSNVRQVVSMYMDEDGKVTLPGEASGTNVPTKPDTQNPGEGNEDV